jgi:small subunit ribosomal protein S12
MASNRNLANNPRIRRKKYCRVKALEGSPQKKGVVYQVAIVTPRKPNSARRQIAKVRFMTTMKRVFCKIPGIGKHFLKNYSVVMVEGHGPKDTPGVNYTLIRGLEDFDSVEKFGRHNRRSKFGTKLSEELKALREARRDFARFMRGEDV